ncbi:hypothetical protein AB0E83_28320 [Streptomyces sp. NPDC035033]|uniref:hypothetical protein n=1 Tax=Streptomyces sp. NPDC035033 TaxID=3155368 RepID=UPI00340990D7
MRLLGISVERVLKGAASGLAVCLLATACGGEEEPEPERVTAEQQCDDTLSPDAARALETVLKTKRFSHDPRGGLERTTDALVADHEKGERRTPTHYLCKANPSELSDTVTVEFRLYRDADLPGGARLAGLHPYEMGVEAMSGPRRARLYIRCTSPRLQGSDKRPARIMGELYFIRSELPDTVPVREAHLTILHSVTLAVVRKLGCEGDAGLTEKPVLKPLPE